MHNNYKNQLIIHWDDMGRDLGTPSIKINY